MFDIGWDELFLIGVIALIVIGPKDLPLAMRAVARLVNRARGLNREFQNSLSEVMREAELDEMRRKFEAAAGIDVGRKVKETIDPTGVIDRAFEPRALGDEPLRQPPASVPAAPDAAAIAAGDGAPAENSRGQSSSPAR